MSLGARDSLTPTYLTRVLREMKDNGVSFDKISADIRKVNIDSGYHVDRRKLRRIADGEDVALRVKELVALDRYLSQRGEGLGERPLFERRSLMEAFVEPGWVRFLLRAYPRDKEIVTTMSAWDVEAMAELIGATHRFRSDVRFDIRDLVVKDDPGPEDRKVWFDALNEPGPAVACIGSPRASPATEIMLASMFGVEPFQPSSVELPFYFIWPQEKTAMEFVSAFSYSEQQMLEHEPDLIPFLGQEGAMAFKICGEETSRRAQKRRVGDWKECGVVVAQRRDQVLWLVVAGLTGATTKAGSIGIRSVINASIPPVPHDTKSNVLWAVVEADISSKISPGDGRRIGAVRVVHGPQYWPRA